MLKSITVALIFICTNSFSQSIAQPFTNASWISPGFMEDTINRPCPIFKKQFASEKRLKSVYLFITVHGLYEASINGKRVGDDYFSPGWTSYDKRLEYQQYDIRDMLKKGINEITVTIGEGWYRGAFGHFMKSNNYGNDASLLCALYVTYVDGSKDTIVSDTTWQSTIGPILYSTLYDGEMYDARIAPTRWSAVKIQAYRKDHLVPSISEPVRKQESFHPKRIFLTPNNEQVIDFGQNLSGWVQVKLKGHPGDTIKLTHAEVLDKQGNFYTGNLRQAKATDIYILKGDKEEIFEPHFTYHGFRYIKVEGCNAKKQFFTAIALYNDMPQTGKFSCSNPLINQLQSNIEWSLKSNFFSIPTDCPQRSERLGWTGDAQVFCHAAAYNRNVNNFFTSWLKDLGADQGSNGAVPAIIPDLYGHLNNGPKRGVAGWGDAATIIPWTLYRMYDDTTVLRQQYSSMKAWLHYIQGQSSSHLWKANGYGDWLAPGDSTSLPYIDQCFWAYSTQLLINAAKVLGETNDVFNYSKILQQIRKAFLENYIDADAKAITHTQTAYVLALQFDMLPDHLRSKAAKHLVQLIRRNNHLATGFLGTPYLLHTLTRYGHTDIAYSLLLQKTCPSWLYPVTMGATTIWEKWDAIKPDSTVQTASYNHYAYGAVGDWLYQTVAGIQPLEAGFKKIRIAPQPGGGLSWIKSSYHCRYGKIVSEWKIRGTKVEMYVVIPAGATATIMIPGGGKREVGPGKYTFQGKVF